MTCGDGGRGEGRGDGRVASDRGEGVLTRIAATACHRRPQFSTLLGTGSFVSLQLRLPSKVSSVWAVALVKASASKKDCMIEAVRYVRWIYDRRRCVAASCSGELAASSHHCESMLLLCPRVRGYARMTRPQARAVVHGSATTGLKPAGVQQRNREQPAGPGLVLPCAVYLRARSAAAPVQNSQRSTAVRRSCRLSRCAEPHGFTAATP